MNPGRRIAIGLVMMLAGWALLFGMVVGWIAPGYGVAAVGFLASLTGVILALLGLARHFHSPR